MKKGTPKLSSPYYMNRRCVLISFFAILFTFCIIHPNILADGNKPVTTVYFNPPVYPIEFDSYDSYLYNTSVTVSFDCQDAVGDACAHTYYTVDGSLPDITSPSGNSVTLDAEGSYSLRYFSVDIDGNREDNRPVIETRITIDKSAPLITITAPPNTGSGSTKVVKSWNGLIEGTATDTRSAVELVRVTIKRKSDDTYYMCEDVCSWIDSSEENAKQDMNDISPWSFSVINPAEDEYVITSYATDTLMNEGKATLTLIIDTINPSVALSLSPTTPDGLNQWYKTAPTVTLVPSDAHIDRAEYQWDSQTGPWIAYSGPFIPTSEAIHILYYRALDLAGNYSEIHLLSLKWNQTDLKNGPLNVTSSPNPTNKSTALVKWDAATSDTIGIDRYEVLWHLRGGDKTYTVRVGNEVREYIIDTLTEGTWEIKITAFDASGNNKSASLDLIVDKINPSAPTLFLAGKANESASLTWSKIDSAISYLIWYGQSSGQYPYNVMVGDTDSYTVKSLGSGNWYFIIKAIDGATNQSQSSNEVSTNTFLKIYTPLAEQKVLGSYTISSPTVLPTNTQAPSLQNKKIYKENRWWLWLLFLLALLFLVLWTSRRKKSPHHS